MRTTGSSRLRARGIALIDCLVYIALMALIFGLAFAAFIETVHHSTELDRLATATVRALHAGEQWREDIRRARGKPAVSTIDGVEEFRLATVSHEIAYAFRDGAVLRRAGSTGPWLEVATGVKVSRFSEDPRKHVAAWRWEIELATRKDVRGFRRVFTFQAVPPAPPPSPPNVKP